MAMNFLLKRSGTANKRPDPASMALGEVDINYNAVSGGLFYKDTCGSVVKVGPAEVGTTAPNSSAAGSAGNSVGEFWYDTSNSALKIWTGSSWTVTGTDGTVTSITAGAGLTGGTITTSGTIALDTSGVTAGTYSNSCVTVDCYGRITSASSGCAPVLLCTVTTKGDLIAATGSAAVTALPAGTDGQFLVACSACSSGLTYVTTTSGTVPDASTTVKGIVELATDAEVQAGTDCTRAVVPSALQSKMSDSVSCTSSCVIASATAVKCAYDVADAALPESTYAAKGDLVAGTGASTYTALGVGSNGYVLTANSACASGLEWIGNCVGTVTSVTGTGAISVDNTNPATPIVSVACASTTTTGVVQLCNSVASSSCTTAATSYALCVVQQVAQDALSRSGGTMGGIITFGTGQTFPVCGIQNATTLQKGVVCLLDSVTSVCTSCFAATPASVKCAYDLANAALPKAGGTMTGNITFNGAQTFPVSGIQDATSLQKGVVQIGSNIEVSTGTISVNSGSTTQVGVLQLCDSVSSTSTALAATPAAVKCSYDLAVGALPLSGGTMTGTLCSKNIVVGTGCCITMNGCFFTGITDAVNVSCSSILATALAVSTLNSNLANNYLPKCNPTACGLLTICGGLCFSAGGSIASFSDSCILTNSDIGATSKAVSDTYTFAATMLPKSGGTMTGDITFNAGQTFPVSGIQDATTTDKGVVQVGTNINVAAGVISVDSGSTAIPGIVQLYDGVDSTSTALALTANQGKNLQDQIDALSVSTNLTLAGTIDGSTGDLLTVTAAGDAKGFVVGDPLPNSTSANEDYFVIVTVPGTMTPPGGSSQVTHQGDWWVSGGNGTGWVFLDVGFNATYATTSTAGVVCLATCTDVVDGTNDTLAIVPATLQGKVSNSVTSTCSNWIASSAAVKCAYDLADAAVPDCTYAAKGVLVAGTGAGTYSALAVGSNDYVLTADSACSNGLKWTALASTPVAASSTVAGTVFGCTCNTEGYNTALGYQALQCFSGVYGSLANVAIGCQSMITIQAAKRNVAVGASTLSSITNGCNNIAVGFCAGWCLVAATGNVIIGGYAGCEACDCNIFLADGCGTVRIRINECGALASGGISCYGTTGQVLTSQGAVAAPQWCDLPASVSCVTAGSGLCGGPITSSGSLCLDTTCVIAPSNYTAKGALVVGCAIGAADVLSVGTNGQVLSANSACGLGLTWVTPCSGTVTSVAAGAGLTGGTITGSGTLCLNTACVIQPTVLTAKGSLISASDASTPVALAVGTDGQVLAANSACTSGLNWVTPCSGTVTSVAAGSGLSGGTITGSGTLCLNTACVIQPTILTAKGALITASAASTPTALLVGTDGQVLTACAACTGGLIWTAAPTATSAAPTTAGVVFGCTVNLCHTALLGYNAGAAATGSTLCLTAIGKNALCLATGSGNTALGANAGCAITTGTNNVAIGPNVAVASATASCQLAIGFSATCNWLTGDSSKNIRPGAGIIDCAGCAGTSGQILTSTGSAIHWKTPETSGWTSAGTIQTVGFCAQTTNPTVGTTDTNNVSYRQVGPKQWEVVVTFARSVTTGASAGIGDYIFTLPNSLSWDTTIPWQTVFSGAVATPGFNTWYSYLLPNSNGWVQISDNFSYYGTGVVPYTNTQYRIITSANATANQNMKPISSSYYAVTQANMTWRVQFQVTST